MAGVPDPTVAREQVESPCRAVMLTCIDYRFVLPARAYLEAESLSGSTDLIAWPGGAMALMTEDADPILSVLELAFALHSPPAVLLAVHRDCGALGGSSHFAGPEDETEVLDSGLEDARTVVRRRFPDTPIRLVRFGGEAATEVFLPEVLAGEEAMGEVTRSTATWEHDR